MPIRKLKEFLDSHNIKYVTLTHSKAYTAQEVAQAAHLPGRQIAKTVMVKMDGKMAMAVLPATHKIDLERLKAAAAAGAVELAHESDFRDAFPECEVGAMPPFGNLYGMPVLVDRRLSEDTDISFNAGSHIELIQLPYKDFERLVAPKLGSFSTGA